MGVLHLAMLSTVLAALSRSVCSCVTRLYWNGA